MTAKGGEETGREILRGNTEERLLQLCEPLIISMCLNYE